MIVCENIVKISTNIGKGYMLKVAFLLASSKVRVIVWPPAGNSCSLGLRYVLLVLIPNCLFDLFSTLVLVRGFHSECSIS